METRKHRHKQSFLGILFGGKLLFSLALLCLLHLRTGYSCRTVFKARNELYCNLILSGKDAKINCPKSGLFPRLLYDSSYGFVLFQAK